MATVSVTHRKVVTIPDDPNYPVGSGEWNDSHVITGLENVQNVDTTNASNITSGTLPSARLPNPIYGGTAPGSTLNLAGTSNVAPANDVISLTASFVDFHPDLAPTNGNFARISSGTGPSGAGTSFSQFYRNADNSGPALGQELGFFQLKAWDGTQLAPTGPPMAIVYGVSEPGGWTANNHGAVIFFQTIPNGQAQTSNEFAIGNGIIALPPASAGEVQGNGTGTVTAGGNAGYYIGSKQVLSSTSLGLGGAAASGTAPLTISGTTITDTNQGMSIGTMNGTLNYNSVSNISMFGATSTQTLTGASAGTNNNAYANFYQISVGLGGAALTNVYTFRVRNGTTGVAPTGSVANFAGVAIEAPALFHTGTPSLTFTATYGVRIANQAIAATGITQGTVYGLWVDTQTNGSSNYLAWFNGTNPVAVQNTGLGYATGAGGTVTQATSKATGVTLSKASGAITMNNAALAAGTIVSFVLTNTAIAATDVLILNHISGGTVGSYSLNAQCAAGSATINVRNNTAGSLSEAIVIQFALIKAVNA